METEQEKARVSESELIELLSCQMIEFNINHEVLVQLTDTGRKELKRQHAELYDWVEASMENNDYIHPEYTPKKEDVDGWSKWQMWDLMHRFGHLTKMGMQEPPFKLTIRVLGT